MVVKGLIKTIDYNGNTCTVRIPVFEGTAGEKETIVQAVIATSPGIYNGYKEDDVVFIAFENNEINMPIVIGKLYLGASKESKDPRGAINAEHLQSATPISIPIDTKLTLNNDPTNLSIARVNGDLSCYKTIADLAKNLKKQETQIGSINIRMIDDGKSWGAEIQKLTDENDLRKAEIRANADAIENSVVHINSKNIQEGLGWHLDIDNWRLFAKDTVEDEVRELDLLRADKKGLTLYGNTRLLGYPTDIETTYASVDTQFTKEDIISGVVTPTWSAEFPQHNDAEYIWQRVATTKYEYDAESETHWKTTTSYEYYCLSTIDAAHISANVAQSTANSSYVLAQGKSTNYYSPDDPATETEIVDGQTKRKNIIKEGDCWFDTSTDTYTKVNEATPKVKNANGKDNTTGYFETKEEYLNYYIYNNDEITTDRAFINNIANYEILNKQAGIYDIDAIEVDSEVLAPQNWSDSMIITNSYTNNNDFSIEVQTTFGENQYSDTFRLDTDASDANYEYWNIVQEASESSVNIRLTFSANNFLTVPPTTTPVGWVLVKQSDLASITPNNTPAYIKDQHTLKQWVGANSDQTPPGHWEDIGGELVANKVTANYINAMDITAKKITVVNPNITPTEEEPEKNILFRADTDVNKVKIAGFDVINETLPGADGWINKVLTSGTLNEDGSIFISPGFKYFADNHYTQPIAIKVGKNFEVSTNGEVTIRKLSIIPDTDPESFSFNIAGSEYQTNISHDGKLSCTNAELTDATIDATKLSFDTVELTKAIIGSTQTYNIIFNSTHDVIFGTDNDENTIIDYMKIEVKDSNLNPYNGVISKAFKLTVEYRMIKDYILDTRTYIRLATLSGWVNKGDGIYELAGHPIVIPNPDKSRFGYSVKSCSLAPKTFTVGATAEMLQINSSFIPATDDTTADTTGYNLGDADRRWNKVYAVDGTIATSDRKEKNTINYNLSSYDTFFDDLKPASFKFNKTHFSRTHLGLIAQDVQESLFNNNLTRKDFGGLVLGGEGFDAKNDQIIDEDTTIYGIGYSELHALEIYEIQKLKKEIKELKEELGTLKQK